MVLDLHENGLGAWTHLYRGDSVANLRNWESAVFGGGEYVLQLSLGQSERCVMSLVRIRKSVVIPMGGVLGLRFFLRRLDPWRKVSPEFTSISFLHLAEN